MTYLVVTKRFMWSINQVSVVWKSPKENTWKFGPGHFNVTLMASDKGNELDFALFKHLLYNNKLVMFVRTQCDNTIRSIKSEKKVGDL